MALKHMTHQQIQEFLDKTLSQPEQTFLEQHLARCERCQQQVETYKTVYKGLGADIGVHFSPKFARNVLRELGKASESTIQRNLWQIFLGLFGIIIGVNISIYYMDVKSWAKEIQILPEMDMSFINSAVAAIKSLIANVGGNVWMFVGALGVILILTAFDRYILQPRNKMASHHF